MRLKAKAERKALKKAEKQAAKAQEKLKQRLKEELKLELKQKLNGKTAIAGTNGKLANGKHFNGILSNGHGRSRATATRSDAARPKASMKLRTPATVIGVEQQAPSLDRALDESLGRQRPAAPAQSDILQLGESAGYDRLCGDKDLAQQVRRHHAGEQ